MRTIWAYVAGFATSFLVIFVLEQALHFFVTMPSGANMNDAAAIDQMMRAMPVAAFAALLVAYIVGSFAGGLTAALVSDGLSSLPSIVTGCVLTIAGAANVFSIYHPTWFRVVSLLTYLPFAYLGCLAARGRRAAH